jgi:hypothetical protein
MQVSARLPGFDAVAVGNKIKVNIQIRAMSAAWRNS